VARASSSHRELEELVEVVNHPLDLAHDRVRASAAGVRRQLGVKRGPLDVMPLVRGLGGSSC
jgi:hypothetical protein